MLVNPFTSQYSMSMVNTESCILYNVWGLFIFEHSSLLHALLEWDQAWPSPSLFYCEFHSSVVRKGIHLTFCAGTLESEYHSDFSSCQLPQLCIYITFITLITSRVIILTRLNSLQPETSHLFNQKNHVFIEHLFCIWWAIGIDNTVGG